MNAVTANPTPQLAPPGAGLPKVELWIGRLIFSWQWRRLPRERIEEKFIRERDLILALAKGCPPEVAAERRLIKRLNGIEDSSRYWSVYMTLDHLRIVNRVTTMTIRGLAQGHPPKLRASTANVKPSPEADALAIEAFSKCCDEFLRESRGMADLHTEARYAHPWFGPLDAAGWHAMAAMHMNLHRRQIERILEAKA
jgi:hypothetical protein